MYIHTYVHMYVLEPVKVCLWCGVVLFSCTERRVIPPDLHDKNEWEIHIVCSAVKYFFRLVS